MCYITNGNNKVNNLRLDTKFSLNSGSIARTISCLILIISWDQQLMWPLLFFIQLYSRDSYQLNQSKTMEDPNHSIQAAVGTNHKRF